MYYPRHNRKAYRIRRRMVNASKQIGRGAIGGLMVALLIAAPFLLP